jgi:hypothetical protein
VLFQLGFTVVLRKTNLVSSRDVALLMHSSPRYVIYKQSFYFSETAFLICKMERVMRMKQSNGSKGRGWVLNFACYTV